MPTVLLLCLYSATFTYSNLSNILHLFYLLVERLFYNQRQEFISTEVSEVLIALIIRSPTENRPFCFRPSPDPSMVVTVVSFAFLATNSQIFRIARTVHSISEAWRTLAAILRVDNLYSKVKRWIDSVSVESVKRWRISELSYESQETRARPVIAILRCNHIKLHRLLVKGKINQ